jgi:uncharacterized protein (TIGR02996 family)
VNEREALLRAVCENPDDDTPRLVFADWLDEHDEPERAEFIRVQIKIARGTDDPKLKQREQELLAAHRAAWSEPFRQFEVEGSSRQLIFGVHFQRGFVHTISANDEELRFVANAPALFQLAPIERVNLIYKAQHEDLTRCPELLQLKELMITRGEGYEAAEIAALCRSKYLSNIVRLDLIADDDNGHLDDEGIETLSRAKTLPALRHLDISSNWCNWQFDDSWVGILTRGKLITQLESLRLRGTWLTDVGVQTLARSKRIGSLSHLDLSNNRIGDEGLRALAQSRTLTRLTTLDLRGNGYEDEDGVEVEGCTSKTRKLLEARFGAGALLDGEADPHPVYELFKQFE